jgi:Zn-dependent peptidase ImmA (M78 family)
MPDKTDKTAQTTSWNRRTIPPNWSPQQIIQHFTESYPVDVIGLAKAFGLEVYERNLDPNVSGMIFRDPAYASNPLAYGIAVNEADPYYRKRFTIAHEIAHFLLHRNKIAHGLKDDRLYRSGMSNQLETQANRLAADILMPRRLIRQLLEQGVTDPAAMASRLQVSMDAMKLRLGLTQQERRQKLVGEEGTT